MGYGAMPYGGVPYGGMPFGGPAFYGMQPQMTNTQLSMMGMQQMQGANYGMSPMGVAGTLGMLSPGTVMAQSGDQPVETSEFSQTQPVAEDGTINAIMD